MPVTGTEQGETGTRPRSVRQPRFPGDVVVIGAGALGGYLAARLALAGQSVSVAARGQRGSEIERRGIVLDMDGQRRAVPVRCRSLSDQAHGVDLVIIATKSASLDQVLAALGKWQEPPRAVLTLQNGVDAPARVAAALPGAAVLAARVHGFFVLAEGVVSHTGVPPEVAFGPWRTTDAAEAERLAARFAAAGVPFARPADIECALWEKFLLACAIGGVGAALGIPVGRLRNDPESWSLLRSSMEEIHDLAAARGVMLPESCVAETLEFVSRFPAEATSSLQRDLLGRRESEYSVLTGAALRMGRELGLRQPALEHVESLLSAAGLLAPEQP